jgi:hypothetical protein
MKLRQMKHSLRDQVLAARFVPLFLEAQPREPALAPHASILSVLAVMGDSSAQRWGEREALTRALVREQQRAPGPFWSGVLLLAFVPMLSYLRGRICGDAFGRDDHDQLVVGAFLEAVACVPMEKRLDRTAMHLRQDTERAVFRLLRQEQAYQKSIADLEVAARADEDFDIFATRPSPTEEAPEELDEMIATLRKRAAGHVPEGRLELVIDTLLRGVRLHDLAAGTLGDASEDDKARAYQRLKRERHRTLVKLRPLLSPRGNDGPLDSQGARPRARRPRRPRCRPTTNRAPREGCFAR